MQNQSSSDDRLQPKHYILAIVVGIPLLYVSVITTSQPFVPSDSLVLSAHFVFLPMVFTAFLYLGFIKKEESKTRFQRRIASKCKHTVRIYLKAAYLLFWMAFLAWAFSEAMIFFSVWPNDWFARTPFRSKVEVLTVKHHSGRYYANSFVISLRIPQQDSEFDLYWPASKLDQIPTNDNPSGKHIICLSGNESFLGKSVDNLLPPASC